MNFPHRVGKNRKAKSGFNILDPSNGKDGIGIKQIKPRTSELREKRWSRWVQSDL